jgi:cell division septum initiation protein DivIVA
MCLVDLWTGETAMNKLGACASFILQGQKIHTVEGAALPLGIIEHVTPMEHSFVLGEGDMLLFMSDGVTDALEEENRALRARADAMTFGREEIGDAILSAKTIAQHLIAEAQEESARILREANEKAAQLISEAERQREAILSDCDGREHRAFLKVQNCYEHLREQHVSSLRQLDDEWQRFLCSLSEEAQRGPADLSEPAEESAPAGEGESLPDDIAQKVSAIADELKSLADERE